MPHTSNEGTGSGARDDKVTKEIMKTRKELMADEFYIGNASTLDKVCWVRDSHADRLAVKREGTDAKGDQPSNVDLAPLAVIGRINDFWMTPDAGYRKGLSIWRDLADVKALCAVRAADEPVIKSDFAAVLKNLAGMQGKVSGRILWSACLTPSRKPCQSLFRKVMNKTMRPTVRTAVVVLLLMDVHTFFIRSPQEFHSHCHGSLLRGKLARAGRRRA